MLVFANYTRIHTLVMQEVSAKIYKHICILIANKNTQKIRYAFLHLELCFVASINWDSIIVHRKESSCIRLKMAKCCVCSALKTYP